MKFSVAMCTYNGAAFLREQLASIAEQTRPPDELVICDDRSGDDTPRIIESFAANASFPVRLRVNEHNLGSTENFARAIGLCRGDLIALSDQDDVWMPEKLRLCEQVFAASPRVGMVFTDAEIVDEKLRSLGRHLWNESGFDEKKKKLIREGRAFDVLLPGWWVTGATMAFRSTFRELVLPIPTDIPMIHDGWISLIIAAVAEVTFIEEPLIRYRQHARQQLGAPIKRDGKGEAAKTKSKATSDAMWRQNIYSDLIISLNAVHQRITRNGMANGHRVSPIEDRLRHLNMRSALPNQAARRLTMVLRELVTMRYHKYSNGVSSAVRDLLRPPFGCRPTRNSG